MRGIYKHLKYLRYLLRHKWSVLRAGMMLRKEYGAKLSLWQLLVHDWTKFASSEWRPYADYFYGEHRWYIPFQEAWLHHQRRNKHHWQYWLLTEDSGKVCPMQMPDRFMWEMLADWMGAGMALNGHGLARALPQTRMWYLTNHEAMQLHPETRRSVEAVLDVITSINGRSLFD